MNTYFPPSLHNELTKRLPCPRCRKNPQDSALLGREGEGHVCGECWTADRHADEEAAADRQQEERRILEAEEMGRHFSRHPHG